MSWLQGPLILLIIFGAMYKVFELFAKRKERVMLISKIAEIQDFDMSKLNFGQNLGRFTTLRAGCLMTGIGLGFLVGFLINMGATDGYLPINYDDYWRYMQHEGGIVYLSCICLFGGAGLILSYILERKANKEDKGKEA